MADVDVEEARTTLYLVALDGSPRAEGVLAYAIRLAHVTGAKLLLFRSFEVQSDMQLAWPLSDKELEAALQAEAQAQLDAHARTVPAELVEAARVDRGVPWRAICAAAQVARAELIVIGSHGYDGLDHLLGTTAARVVNHADRPVLVVRPIASGR